MKKAILSLAVFSALGFSAVSHAASIGATGNISFNGGLTAETCSLENSGATGTGGNLSYDMGVVTTKSLGSEAAPATPVTVGGIASSTTMNLKLACASGSSVELKLTPTTRVNKGIGVSGGATNVQIMLMQGSSTLDFSTGSATLTAPLSGGVANFVLNAYYTLQADKTIAQVTTGSANGSLAYVLSYN